MAICNAHAQAFYEAVRSKGAFAFRRGNNSTFCPYQSPQMEKQYDEWIKEGNSEWPPSKMITGDFQGSDKTDIAILYDYPNAETGLWLFSADSNFQPKQVWTSGKGNWEWSRSKVITGNFQSSNKTDIAVLYDYPNAETGLWLFSADSNFQPKQVWTSGKGNWEWSRS